MAGRKERDIWQYGDFQTPQELAARVCTRLRLMGIDPSAVLEPTCGRGAFLAAAAETFPDARHILGVDINTKYVAEAREACGGRARVEQGDFFRKDWTHVLDKEMGSWLVLGNPPWVTNAELGLLRSKNLPNKSNFQGYRGFDAVTGKANFDISEWMLLKQVAWLKERSGWIAMLVKTAVARKVLRQAWKACEPVGRAAIFKVDAMRHFGAAVDACLFVLPVGQGTSSRNCDVFDGLEECEPSGTVGCYDGMLVQDINAFVQYRHLLGSNGSHLWRSGVKHDCAKIMDLTRLEDGRFANGLGEVVEVEDNYLFPMLKSSDVAKGRKPSDRMMIVPQREIGEDTSHIRDDAPRTWAYLSAHEQRLDGRGSVIYRGKPRFSIFGVGAYTFAPWKIAISGFYKVVRFEKVGPACEKPVVFDDTVYFLPCWSEHEAEFVHYLVQSIPYSRLLNSMIFTEEKRPITAELLRRISLEKVAKGLGMSEEYDAFSGRKREPQLSLALGM